MKTVLQYYDGNISCIVPSHRTLFELQKLHSGNEGEVIGGSEDNEKMGTCLA